MKPSFLYFDLGNVLLSFSHERMCRQMAEVAGVSPEAVRSSLFDASGQPGGHSVQWQFERGDLNALAVYEYYCEAHGVRPEKDQLFTAGCNIFDEIAPSVELVEQLKDAGHRLGIMSNTNSIDWGFVSSGRFPFINRCFEHYVLSFEVRAMKPEREIYDQAVRIARVPADRVFFADDRQENVDGALAAGLDAVLFTTTKSLINDLRQRGVSERHS
jgi:FMN phosphatase YigB (HAD superfamily)